MTTDHIIFHQKK